jgi:GT2 family glycosyltransferase
MTPERLAETARPLGTPPLVGVVILNWNQARLTLRSVEHVLAQRHVPGEVSVIVVDNGSREDEIAVLETGLPRACLLLRNDQNLGFAGGMNVGIKAAADQGCAYLWALNNDAFPEPGCLAALVHAMDSDNTLAAASPRLLNSDGTQQILSGEIDLQTGGLRALPVASPIGRGTWYVTGAAIFVRSSALAGEPAFDDRFFAYWEDTDLCVRLLRRQWRLAVVESAVCVHLGSASAGSASPLVMYLMARNVSLFLYRQQAGMAWLRAWLRHAAVQIVHATSLNNAAADARARAVLAGVWDGTRGRFGAPKRLAPPERIARFVFKHYWFIARTMWGASSWLTMATSRRDEQPLTLAAVLESAAAPNQ